MFLSNFTNNFSLVDNVMGKKKTLKGEPWVISSDHNIVDSRLFLEFAIFHTEPP